MHKKGVMNFVFKLHYMKFRSIKTHIFSDNFICSIIKHARCKICASKVLFWTKKQKLESMISRFNYQLSTIFRRILSKRLDNCFIFPEIFLEIFDFHCVNTRERLSDNDTFSVFSHFQVFTVFRMLTDFVCLYNYEF